MTAPLWHARDWNSPVSGYRYARTDPSLAAANIAPLLELLGIASCVNKTPVSISRTSWCVSSNSRSAFVLVTASKPTA